MKIGAFITVRLGSTRLPNKAILEIKGKSTIVHLIERIKLAKNIDKIVLCTTTNPEDQKLIEVAKEQHIDYFAGDENNILKRHYDAALYHKLDFIINVDGDDLFCDPEYIDEIADEAQKRFDEVDVISTRNLPFGVNSFGYKLDCLKSVFEEKKVDVYTGWGEFFKNNESLKTQIIDGKAQHTEIQPRMSLDYQEDFDFFEAIYNNLYKGTQMSLDEIINLLKNKPEIIEINKSVEEEYWKNYEKEKKSQKEGK